jgi:flavin-binding protein dodecin
LLITALWKKVQIIGSSTPSCTPQYINLCNHAETTKKDITTIWVFSEEMDVSAAWVLKNISDTKSRYYVIKTFFTQSKKAICEPKEYTSRVYGCEGSSGKRDRILLQGISRE